MDQWGCVNRCVGGLGIQSSLQWRRRGLKSRPIKKMLAWGRSCLRKACSMLTHLDCMILTLLFIKSKLDIDWWNKKGLLIPICMTQSLLLFLHFYQRHWSLSQRQTLGCKMEKSLGGSICSIPLSAVSTAHSICQASSNTGGVGGVMDVFLRGIILQSLDCCSIYHMVIFPFW